MFEKNKKNKETSKSEERTCSCKVKDNCQLFKVCITNGFIYKAIVKYYKKETNYI